MLGKPYRDMDNTCEQNAGLYRESCGWCSWGKPMEPFGLTWLQVSKDTTAHSNFFASFAAPVLFLLLLNVFLKNQSWVIPKSIVALGYFSLYPACVELLWRGARRETGSPYSNMATYSGQNATGISDVDLLLHPELLSEDFMQLILREVS